MNESTNEFGSDPLARRLVTLESRVDTGALVRAALGRRTRRATHRRLTFALVAVPFTLAVATFVSSYFAPVFAQAVADAPIGGAVTGWMLRNAGLAGVPHRVTMLGDTTTSSGYSVTLAGGYADSGRTILFVRVAPAARIDPIHSLGTEISLTDQFGQRYRMTGAVENSVSGENTLLFEPLRWPATLLGARFRLAFDAIGVGLPPAERAVSGDWVLSGTVAAEEGHALALPAPGSVGPMSVAFTTVRATESAVLIELRLEPNGLDLQRTIPDGVKGRNAFGVHLRDDAGADAIALQSNYGSITGGVAGSWMWLIERPGRYDLEIAYEGVGSLTRSIDVP